MAFSPRILSLVTFVLIVVGGALNIAATATSYWVTNGDIHEGLLKHFEKDGSVEDIDGRGALKATKTLMILGCLCYFVSMGYWMLMSMANKTNVKVLSAIVLLNCLLQVVALSIYANSPFLGNRDAYTSGWSYILGWISASVEVGASALCMVKRTYTAI